MSTRSSTDDDDDDDDEKEKSDEELPQGALVLSLVDDEDEVPGLLERHHGRDGRPGQGLPEADR